MVLTKSELIALLQNEVRVLLHLAGKAEPQMRDYRPTPKQRSTLELLQYLSIMGPELVKATKAGAFNVEAWTVAEQAAKARDWDQTLAALAHRLLGASALDHAAELRPDMGHHVEERLVRLERLAGEEL